MTVMGDAHALRDLFLLPIRDCLAPIVWAAGLIGNRIVWRGDVFSLKEGRLERIADEPGAQPEVPRLSH
jgi:ceramide glucosyltransferase